MADLWGALAQSSPAATTLTAAYTVPTAKNATVEVVACNRGAAGTIRLSHAINGAADTVAQYLIYDYLLDANVAKSTVRFTAKAGDIIRVQSSTGNVSFNVNGIEEDA
jgi:hypothetical protein